jgi:hypothetical protein
MSLQTKCLSISKSNPKPKGEKVMSANPNAVPEYRNLPITALVESATNPRRRFNEERLQELAASFQSQGILAPLLVRELEESKYEVIAGARRLRAAKLAALDTVPVRVVALSDAAPSSRSALKISSAKTFTRWRRRLASAPCWS